MQHENSERGVLHVIHAWASTTGFTNSNPYWVS